jgi:hypothetical protein
LRRGQQRDVVQEGKLEDGVVWRDRLVFLRLEQLLELLRVKLRSEGRRPDRLDKAKSGAYLGDMSRWKLLLGL